MNARQLALTAILLPFLALTGYVLATTGYVGFFVAMLRSPATGLGTLDLTISLGLILVWMAADRRETQTPFAPYAAITLAFGAAGPLLYLIHREARVARRAPSTANAARA